MQFMLKALDGADALKRRLAARPRHLENMARLKEHVICGGGLLDEEGKMKGSVLILEFPGKEDMDEYLRTEPYVVENVWEQIEVQPLNVVILKGERVGK